MRSVQTVASVHAQRARTSSACLAVADTTADGVCVDLLIPHPPSCVPSLPRGAPSGSPGFVATMDALTPERSALRLPSARRLWQPEHRLGCRSGLPALCVWPSDHSVSNHLTAPVIAFVRYPSASWASDICRSGLRQSLAGSPVSPAESSSQLLRTGRSPPVASHPLSQGRSYFQLQAGARLLDEDLPLPHQTHSPAP